MTYLKSESGDLDPMQCGNHPATDIIVQAMGRGRLLPADALAAMKIKDFSGLKDMNWIIF